MKYVCLYSLFLIPVITIAHPLVDHDVGTPVEARKAAASPGSTPSRNPLPEESNGLLSNGQVVNSVRNYDSVNNSCSTQPNIPNQPHSSAAYDPDTCQICVIQNGIGPDAWYAAWVRDANNTAVGNMPAIELGPGTSEGKDRIFVAAGDFLIISVSPSASSFVASAVSMMWGYQPAPQMIYNPNPTSDMVSKDCAFQSDDQDGKETYFQCHFKCGLAFDLNERDTLDLAPSNRKYQGDDRSSISNHLLHHHCRKHTLSFTTSQLTKDPRIPLPAEKDGVLLDGTHTIINPNPDNNANATKDPHSCWTKPAGHAVPMDRDDFAPGLCQICMTQWGFGPRPPLLK